MAEEQLTVTISGVCVNVFDYVPGVPMRTVLPDAMSVRFGSLLMPGDNKDYIDVSYYLMPHVATVRTSLLGGGQSIGVGTENGQLFGSYISVLNAKPQPFVRVAPEDGYKLGDYASQVHPSPDVVLNGRALAYFDCFGGTVQTLGSGNEPRTAQVTIVTEGTPRVSITSLPGTSTPVDSTPFETNELYISNLDLEPATEDAEFDFLLNYLVTQEGIPRVLTRRVPGLSPQPREFSLERLGERMRSLGLFLQTEGTVAGWQKSTHPPQLLAAPGSSGSRSARRSALAREMAARVIDPVPFDPSCSYGNLP